MEKLEKLKTQRDELNENVKEQISQKKVMLNEIKDLRKTLSESKKERNTENVKVAEFKKKRSEAFSKVKKHKQDLAAIFETVDTLKDSVDRPYRVLKNQLEKMDWEYQTGVFSVKREKEMVKRMDDLERQLAKSEILYDKGKEVHAIQKELRELYAEANVYHQLVLNHASESEKHHQEAIKCFKRIDELSSGIDKMDEKIVKTKMEADNAHAEFLINKRELLGAEKKKWKKEKGVTRISDSELRKKAEKILEDFRSGKKITIEELSLLEKSGL